MLAFVDESGYPGMKLGKGSSDYLIITMVIFQTEDSAREAEFLMNEVRRQFGWKEEFEFHFHDMSPKRKIAFLERMVKASFCYYSIVIDKAKLTSENFQKHPASLYKSACNYLFSNAKNILRDAIVVVDGSGDRHFRLEFQAYLRKRANEHVPDGGCMIRKVKIQDSVKNDLIQLADMVCGAVARSFSGKSDALSYCSIIQQKEAHVQVRPK